MPNDLWVMDDDGSDARQVTLTSSGPHFFGAPAWSPDGSRIAFASDRDGDMEVYVKDVTPWLSTGEDREVTAEVERLLDPAVNATQDSANTGMFGLAWSADGSQLAFTSDREGNFDIWVMGADGSDPAT